MNSSLAILGKLKIKRISISLDDSFENLRIRGEVKNLSPLDKLELIENKADLISFLKDQILVNQTIGLVKKQPGYPISDAQRRLWVLSQFEEGSVAYNMPGTIYLNQDIDIEHFKRAIESTIERHEILRTVFKEDETKEVRQWTLERKDLDFKIDYKDFRKTQNKQHAAQSYIKEDSYKIFDLEKGPLLRASLLQMEDKEYLFYFNMHHIISDGWSMGVLTKDVFAYYKAFVENKQPELKPLRIQYKDYSTWQIAQLKEDSNTWHKAYWLNRLKGDLPLLDLPGSKIRPNVKTHKGRAVVTYLNKVLTDQLKNYALENDGTLFMSIISIIKTLIYRYTGQKDVILGTTIAGRDHADLEDQIGFYVNALALRTEINGMDSFDRVYQKVRHTILEAYTHQRYPFDRLVEELGQSRLTSRSAVFDITVVLQNAREKIQNIYLPEERIDDIIEFDERTSKNDLKFDFQEEGDYLRMRIEYNTDIYEGAIIEEFIHSFKKFITLVFINPTAQIESIDYFSQEGKPIQLSSDLTGGIDYSEEKTIVDLFQDQEKKHKQNPIIRFGSASYSYEELNKRSNHIAHFLLEESKLQRGEKVGLLLKPGVDAISSMLGVLKAGGAYVPMDKDLPEDSLLFIASDAGVRVLIIEKECIELGNRLQWGVECVSSYLCIDSDDVKSGSGQYKNVIMSQELWDLVGERAEDQITGGGWLSSYTGKPITHVEMEEYSMNAYEKLKDSLHSGMRVLEIGCSSGLTLCKIAPVVSFYYGTDLSPVIIANTQTLIAEKGFKNVKLRQLAAHDISKLDEKYDLIIINSVIHAFPDHNYLLNVIQDCIALLSEEGRIFIGDVMDINKKKYLIEDLEAFKRDNRDMGYTTKTDVSSALFISRGYFEDLMASEEEIIDVSISEKIRTIENELTKFRYDVMLQIDKGQPGKKNKKTINKQRKKHKWQYSRIHLDSKSQTDPETKIMPRHRACINYISISKDKSKQVSVEHRDIVGLLRTHKPTFYFYNSNLWKMFNCFAFNYSAWQLAVLEKELFKSKTYWLDKLSGNLPLLNLPSTKQRPKIKTYNGYALGSYIDQTILSKLKDYLDENGGNVFISLLAAWNILMYRYTSQKDIIVGSLVMGREHVDLDNPIGFYINTLALRNEIKPEESFNTFYRTVKESVLQDYNHQMYPFDRLIKELDLASNTSRTAVFDILLMFQNSEEKREGIELKKVESGQIVDLGGCISKFDLEISIEESEDGLVLQVIYNQDVYEREIVERMINHYRQLLKAILRNPEEKVSKIDYLSQEEKNELLVTFNATATGETNNKTIVDIFQEQVSETPDNIAVVFEEKELSYKQLDEVSNQLAYYLQANYKIRPDDLAGIKLERSEWMIISILGVLKSGAAYVPIDQDYPADRIAYMLENSNCKVCIDETELNIFRGKQKEYPVNKLKTGLRPDNLAYLIYTSGSTGKPKGVMIEHASLINYNNWFTDTHKITREDSSMVISSPSFDGIFTCIYGCLLNGGLIHLLRKDVINSPGEVTKYVKSKGITFLKATPPYLTLLINSTQSDELLKCKALRFIMTGGDKVDLTYVNKIINYSNIYVINHYGPTESTIGSSSYIVTKENLIEFNVHQSIGRPVLNTQIYFLNEAAELQPKGVVGELYIGGAGLARGYLNHDELQTEKFVKNPFNIRERLYRTGDLGRWLPDGNIEFIGRKDDQVKIRGNRVELGEIEHALQRHREIEGAVVIARENQLNEKELVAYITSKAKQHIDELKSYLKETLPEYMLPTYYVQLEKLPLTSNGKIDKKSLPEPKGLGLASGVEYVAPKNKMEGKLVEIWQKLLQRENIGIKDDFFAMGGHSLKAVRLSNEYQKELAVKLSLKDLFTYTSIESHIELIRSSGRSVFFQIEKVALQESYSISNAQRRLWILSQFEKGSVAYNAPGHIYLNQDIEIEKFKRAIDATIDRHEILRTVFKEDESGQIRQWILEREDLGFVVDYQDFRKEANKKQKAEEYIAADAFHSFDLEKGPLLRAALLQVDEEEYVFYFNMHHIINDGWSMEVLTRDVFKYYESYKAGKEPQIKELRIQYKDYSAWQLAQVEKGAYKEHQAFWLDQLSGELPLLDLPATKQRPQVKTYRGHSLATYLDEITTTKLKEYTQEKGGSLFMGLLALWNVLMYRYTSQKDIIMGVPVAGREHGDLEDQIGFYVNMLALRNKVNPEESFDSFYQVLKENTLKSYSHQMYPFDRLVEDLNLQRDTSRSAVFDVTLTFQNNGERIKGVELSDKELNQTVDLGYSTTKFDIEILAQEIGDYLSLKFVFNPDVYEKSMVEGLIRHYKQLLNALLEAPKEKISQIDYLSHQEKHELLVAYNDTVVAYPKDKTIVDLFEEQVEKTPDNIALVFRDKKLTYNELDKLSNRLAHCLIENYKIKPDDLVGMMLNRSEWSIISILGILKAGGAYVPIDPDDPSSRRNYIVNDALPKVLITEVNFIHDIDYFGGDIFSLDVEFEPEYYSADRIPVISTPDNLAYVIYTSGSTGKPKGVMITSRAIVDYFFGMLNKANINECESFGLVSTTSADLGNTVIYASLLIGASLHVIAKENIINADKMRKLNLDCIKMTPSHWKALQTDELFFTPNKCLILGGEPFSAEILKYVKLTNNACEVYNHYGPTEATIGKLLKHVDKNQGVAKVSLGGPIGDNKVYILNPNQQLCPVGLPGEICISGVGLAKGYLKQQELTKMRFVNNPFAIGERLYKTGDLGRWLSAGNIEFLGRVDEQVKIRGFRIELEEIKLALLNLEGIEDAIVVVKENQSNEKELVAYIVAKSSRNSGDLRYMLRKSLPEYMIPAFYVELEAIPLTLNGKVDRDSLPDPRIMGIVSGVEYIAPRNETEEKIIEIITDILRKPKSQISVYDNFFDIGISSLGLMNLYDSINKNLNSNLQAVSIFEFSTVNTLAAYIVNGSKPKVAELKVENIAAELDDMIDLM